MFSICPCAGLVAAQRGYGPSVAWGRLRSETEKKDLWTAKGRLRVGVGYATIQGVGKEQGTQGMPMVNLRYVYGMSVKMKAQGRMSKVGSRGGIVCT